MKIIIGHTNMDLDCIGSIVLARYLFPEHVPVRSRLLHPVAKKMYNIYQHQLNFINPKDLKGQHIEEIVVVDTRGYPRIKEYFQFIENDDYQMEIYDHHPGDEQSFPKAIIHQEPCGANTSQLGKLLMERKICIQPEDATVALAGIYADTGNFTHENVRDIDFDVASYLLSCQASLSMVKRFLKPLSASYQVSLFHELLNQLQYHTVHGHQVISAYWETDNEAEGLGAIVEKVFEVENQDLIFALFHFPKRKKSLIIARNQKKNIDLGKILRFFGGGGHPQAASAIVKHTDGRFVYRQLLEHLELMLAPAVTAGEIMSTPVDTVDQSESLLAASLLLEEKGHTGLPVLEAENKLVGFITLRDIMKGRRAQQMHAPVKGYMSRHVISTGPETTVRRIEELLFENNIGHLPIVEEGRILGIVTRTDYLEFARDDKRKKQKALQESGIEIDTALKTY